MLNKEQLMHQISNVVGASLIPPQELPDIQLYVEQMTSYLEDKLGDYVRSGDEKVFTKAMVNNYTKAGLLPRPVQKKYGKEHMISLIDVFLLKQTLSFQQIEEVFSLTDGPDKLSGAYGLLVDMVNSYRASYIQQVESRIDRVTAQQLDGQPLSEREQLFMLIALMSLEATVNKLVCSRLLNSYVAQRQAEEERGKEREKEEKARRKEKNGERETPAPAREQEV